MKYRQPVDSPRVTQPFSKTHTGIDYGHPDGTPVFATESGTILIANDGESRQWIANGANDPYKPATGTRALRTEDYGNFIKISHGNGEATLYAHLKNTSLQVKAKQTVIKGQFIGRVGSTGNSTGNHLHYELRKDDKCIEPVFEEENMSQHTDAEWQTERDERNKNWTLYQETLTELSNTKKTLNDEIEKLKLRIEELEKQPAPVQPKGALELITLSLQAILEGRWK